MRTRDLRESWSSKKTVRNMLRWIALDRQIIVTYNPIFQVTKMLGNGRLEAMCFDGVKRLCHIRGKLRKKVWINQSDIILVGLRDYQVIYSVLSISLFSMLFPSGRQGRRHSQIFRGRGEKPEILWRVSRIHQDHGHCGLCWRRFG